MSNNNLFTERVYANHSDGIFVNFICRLLHEFQILTKQRLPNVHISMITSTIAVKMKCWAIVHDTNWPFYYTTVFVLQWPKTPKQVFVAKYLVLEQNKQIWDETLCSRHLSIADTFSRSRWCPLWRGFTVFQYCSS